MVKNRRVQRKSKKSRPASKPFFKWLLITAAIIFSVVLATLYILFLKSNVNTNNEFKTIIYIPSHTSYNELIEKLEQENLISNQLSFLLAAKFMNLDEKFKPGRYAIEPNTSNLNLIRKLRNGSQEPIKLTLQNIRTKAELVKLIDAAIESDSAKIMETLDNDTLLANYDLNPEQAMCLFLPATHEIYWTTSPEKLLEKVGKHYLKFWNHERLNRLQQLNITKAEAIILASIVEKETTKPDERPTVAGVYINRLNANMKLQADPTVVFANQDFSITRITGQHLKKDSPYNTYLYHGLPPGPICLPSIASIDAVLDYHKHDYLFFCAKEDFSGYHNFAKNYSEHLKNAAAYQKELDRLNIK